jgi:CubicO group peptidase (beta-lactamase class C family)
MVEPLRHRQTKGAETDMPGLQPLRHTSTLLYLPGIGYGFGLGFAVRLTVGQAPYPGSEGDYGWVGSAGTVFWVDPKEDLMAVFMAQRFGVWPHYTRLIRTLVYQSLVR